MNVFYPDQHMMVISSMVEDVKNRYMMAKGCKPEKVFISSDWFFTCDVPLEINGIPVFEHPSGGSFVFCAS